MRRRKCPVMRVEASFSAYFKFHPGWICVILRCYFALFDIIIFAFHRKGKGYKVKKAKKGKKKGTYRGYGYDGYHGVGTLGSILSKVHKLVHGNYISNSYLYDIPIWHIYIYISATWCHGYISRPCELFIFMGTLCIMIPFDEKWKASSSSLVIEAHNILWRWSRYKDHILVVLLQSITTVKEAHQQSVFQRASAWPRRSPDNPL